MKHDELMEMALSISYQQMGRTSPNPPVGAVVARDGRVLGSGGTCSYGCDHAEVMAISNTRKNGFNPAGAEIYVTLEPCNHYGKTPPCTEGIISSGIRKVYLPVLDPNPLVAGKGVRRLREAGIEVEILERYSDASADLLRPFKKIIETGRPFVLNKCAETLDGRIAASSGDSRWISSPASRLLVHRLRNRVDAIIIGKNTLAGDNPKLTVRLQDFSEEESSECMRSADILLGRDNYMLRSLLAAGETDIRDPLRVVIGLPEDIKGDEAVFHDKNHHAFITEDDYNSFVKAGKSGILNGINISVIDTNDRIAVVDKVLCSLGEKGVMFAMVEGGGAINASFLESNSTDQFMYIISPRIAGGGIPVINGSGPEHMADSLRLNDVTACMLGGDMLFTGYRKKSGFITG